MTRYVVDASARGFYVHDRYTRRVVAQYGRTYPTSCGAARRVCATFNQEEAHARSAAERAVRTLPDVPATEQPHGRAD
jgi:hypothetical protein